MIRQFNLIGSILLIIISFLIAVEFNEAQFISSYMRRRQDRAAQRLLKEITDLELPTLNQHKKHSANSKLRTVNSGESNNLNDKLLAVSQSSEEFGPSSLGGLSLPNELLTAEFANGGAKKLNNLFGLKVKCARLELSPSHRSMRSLPSNSESNNPEMDQMLSSFEKLVDQVSARYASSIGLKVCEDQM